MKANMAVLIVAVFLVAALGSGCQSYEACTPDCSGKFCGDDDGCGGYCTDCPAGQICNAATWQCEFASGCVPNCTNKTCGAYDGCGGRCTACPGGGICDAATWTCLGGCNPDCAGKTCGDYDGCGGRCTGCPVGQACNAATWTCQGGCTPDCTGRMCGDSDGCGGFCSACPPGQTCIATGQGYSCVSDQEDLALVSDSSWRASLVEVPGWTTVGFDDSGWSMAVTPAPERCGMEFTPELMGRPYRSWERPGVQTMWSREQQRFVYVRKSFYVPSASAVTSSMLSVISDDDHIFYINGTRLYAEQDGLAGPIIETDLAPYLRTGTNVIAMMGDDSCGGCRWFMVNGTISYGGCTPDCSGKTCGDSDGCGGRCTNCPTGQVCNAATWQCQGWCGNGICDAGESCSSCSLDCGGCSECPGLTGYWRLDEGSGNIANDSVGNHTGSLQLSPTWITGKLGKALSFNGSNYVRIDDSYELDVGTGDFSIEAWVSIPVGQQVNGRIVSHGSHGDAGYNGYSLVYWEGAWGDVARRGVAMRIGKDQCGEWTVGTCFAMDDGQWHHYAATANRNGRLEFYVDGSLLSSPCSGLNMGASWGPGGPGDITTLAGSNLDCPCSMCLGASCQIHGSCPGATAQHFVGDLDEVAFYKRVLTAEEINDHYANGDGMNVCPVTGVTGDVEQKAVHYSYNYCDCEGIVYMSPGEMYEIYNQPGGCGPNDVARCYLDDSGRVSAYNHDSCDSTPNWGDPVYTSCSEATYSSYIVRCCIQ